MLLALSGQVEDSEIWETGLERVTLREGLNVGGGKDSPFSSLKNLQGEKQMLLTTSLSTQTFCIFPQNFCVFSCLSSFTLLSFYFFISLFWDLVPPTISSSAPLALVSPWYPTTHAKYSPFFLLNFCSKFQPLSVLPFPTREELWSPQLQFSVLPQPASASLGFCLTVLQMLFLLTSLMTHWLPKPTNSFQTAFSRILCHISSWLCDSSLPGSPAAFSLCLLNTF